MPRHPVRLPDAMMDERLALILLFAAIAAVYLALFAVSRRKRLQREAFLRRLDETFRGLNAEPIGDGLYRWRGRVYSIHVDDTPLLKRELSLRLAVLAPGTAEFELKRADNVPLTMPEALRSHPFYRAYVVAGPVTSEVQAHLMTIADTLTATLPDRWGAFSHHYVERVLFSNVRPYETYPPELEHDLTALGTLAAVPLERADRPARFTIRHGFEKDPPGWHWTAEERLRWGERLSRSCVSAWHGSPLLNAALLRIFHRLAGPERLTFLMNREPPAELALTYAELSAAGLTAECSDSAAIAADAFMDAAFFGGAIAGGDAPQVPPYARHRAALEGLAHCLFYVRRLRDDEDSWFAGEYEILSARIDHARVEEAVRAVAGECGATVTEIDRPFSPKLLKDDRLDFAP